MDEEPAMMLHHLPGEILILILGKVSLSYVIHEGINC